MGWRNKGLILCPAVADPITTNIVHFTCKKKELQLALLQRRTGVFSLCSQFCLYHWKICFVLMKGQSRQTDVFLNSPAFGKK